MRKLEVLASSIASLAVVSHWGSPFAAGGSLAVVAAMVAGTAIYDIVRREISKRFRLDHTELFDRFNRLDRGISMVLAFAFYVLGVTLPLIAWLEHYVRSIDLLLVPSVLLLSALYYQLRQAAYRTSAA